MYTLDRIEFPLWLDINGTKSSSHNSTCLMPGRIFHMLLAPTFSKPVLSRLTSHWCLAPWDTFIHKTVSGPAPSWHDAMWVSTVGFSIFLEVFPTLGHLAITLVDIPLCTKEIYLQLHFPSVGFQNAQGPPPTQEECFRGKVRVEKRLWS